MPRRTATPPPMFPMSPSRRSQLTHFRSLLNATVASALLGASGFAMAQTPVCFDSVGRALPTEQCSQAARDQAAAQQATASAAEPSKREHCKALADKIASTPDKPVYKRDQRVDSPAGNRVDIPTRTNPRKALKEQYMRECT
ncbi:MULTISPECIES: hypothetical protein [Pandoraea]|uniref:hypothetical protein n=1 Tax=Pandoraea TaxID=93217 RepID=UPI001F5DAC5E|nr:MULTISPECIES: hypothetical protein [Pandoraea]MCI3206988.1 hypothetical protein [Pandoraea sp. LA3]MDN4585016.1 hypothetical protein [Pandoraea capi]